MTDSPHARANIFALLILTLSAATMLWLFWHYPLGTAIVTIVVVAMLGIYARLARSIEPPDGVSGMKRG
jgi:uncharacterized membrane protein AbrB (regulator of aidB expression)